VETFGARLMSKIVQSFGSINIDWVKNAFGSGGSSDCPIAISEWFPKEIADGDLTRIGLYSTVDL
jgi:hypothetical protein